MERRRRLCCVGVCSAGVLALGAAAMVPAALALAAGVKDGSLNEIPEWMNFLRHPMVSGGDGKEVIAAWMAASFVGQPAMARMIRSLYAYSGIETRYGCTTEYLVPPEISRFAPARTLDESPTTAERLAIYEREAPILGTAAARAELANYAASAGVDGDTLPAFITHLIVVSCTGFFAPGLDFMIARELGLARPPPVAR